MIRLRGEVIPVRTPFPDDDEGILRRFDRLCQMALKGEAINYYKYMDYRRKNEIMLSELSENELGKLYTEDVYSVENSMFDVLGYDIEVKDALLAEALKELTQRRRNVILLSFFMDMNDAEIAREMKIVRSTVHEHRKRSLEVLKNIMEMLKNEKKE